MRIWVVCALAVSFGCGDDPAIVIPDAAIDAPPPPPDAFVPPDARIANLACNNDPIETVATDPVNITGNTVSLSPVTGITAVADATIEVRDFADPDGTPLETATSDVNGDYAIALATGTVAADVFLRVTAANLLPTEEFSPTVLTADQMVPAVLFDAQTIGLLAQFTGQSQDLGTNGLAVVLMVDCDQQPIEAATVVTPPGVGGVVYAGADGLPDSSLDRTSTSGTAFVFDVPPAADVVFDAEVMGMSLRDNHVRIEAGTVAAVVVAPGTPPPTL